MFNRYKLQAVIAVAGILYPATVSADIGYSRSHQGIERCFELHMPPGKTSRPLPLVISLRGKGQPLTSLRRWLRLTPVADRESFAIAYPIALRNQCSYSRTVAADMPTAGGQPADYAGFMQAIIDRLIADGTADAERV